MQFGYTGYKAGSWAPALPAAFNKDSDKEYTYTYVKNSYGYTVEYYFDSNKAAAGDFAPVTGNAEFEQNTRLFRKLPTVTPMSATRWAR